jgi:hypothetical protein
MNKYLNAKKCYRLYQNDKNIKKRSIKYEKLLGIEGPEPECISKLLSKDPLLLHKKRGL